jgi:DNA repair protein RadC
MSITNWPLKERPRERLLKLGAQALSNAELLAIFLRTGIPGKTALDLARELLSKFGSLRMLMEAKKEEFCGQKGLGVAKFAQLQAVTELSNRCMSESLQEGTYFENTMQTKQYVISQLGHQKREVFACLFLDSQHTFICFEILFYGSIRSASIHPREIVKRALELNAAAVIFAHNHPSGDPTPSLADKQLTQQLLETLDLIDIRVLDHMVVGGNKIASFAELNLLQPPPASQE